MYFSKINDLETFSGTLNPDEGYVVGGYYVENDDGAGIFRWHDSGTQPPSDGAMIIHNNTSTNGWFERIINEHYINVKWFGAKGDNVADDSTSIIAALAYVSQDIAQCKTLFFPKGIYKITEDNVIGKGVKNLPGGVQNLHMLGEGSGNSILLLENDTEGTYHFYNEVVIEEEELEYKCSLLFPIFEHLSFSCNKTNGGSITGFAVNPNASNAYISQGFKFLNVNCQPLTFEWQESNTTDIFFSIDGNVNGSENRYIDCRFFNIGTILQANNAQAVNQEYYNCDVEGIKGDAFLLANLTDTLDGAPSAIKIYGGSWIFDKGIETIDEWRPNKSYSQNNSVIFDGRVYNANNSGTSGDIPPTHETGSVSDGGITWDFSEDESQYMFNILYNDPHSVPMIYAEGIKTELKTNRAKLIKTAGDEYVSGSLKFIFSNCDFITAVHDDGFNAYTTWTGYQMLSAGTYYQKYGRSVYKTIYSGGGTIAGGSIEPKHLFDTFADDPDAGIPWQFIYVAAERSVINLTTANCRDIVFENCTIPDTFKFNFPALSSDAGEYRLSNIGNVSLRNCEVPNAIADRANFGDNNIASRFDIIDCYVSRLYFPFPNPKHLSSPDWAMDMSINAIRTPLAGRNANLKSKQVYFRKMPDSDLPTGGYNRVVLPPGAILMNVFIYKPEESSAYTTSYQLEVCNDDGSISHAILPLQQRKDEIKFVARNLMYQTDTSLNNRIIRLRCYDSNVGDYVNDWTPGSYFMVEYY